MALRCLALADIAEGRDGGIGRFSAGGEQWMGADADPQRTAVRPFHPVKRARTGLARVERLAQRMIDSGQCLAILMVEGRDASPIRSLRSRSRSTASILAAARLAESTSPLRATTMMPSSSSLTTARWRVSISWRPASSSRSCCAALASSAACRRCVMISIAIPA